MLACVGSLDCREALANPGRKGIRVRQEWRRAYLYAHALVATNVDRVAAET